MPPQQMTTGPALIEGVERMNVVVRGSGQGMGVSLRRDPYAMSVEDLGTWPTTAGTKDREVEWQREEDWNMEKESRELMNTWTI